MKTFTEFMGADHKAFSHKFALAERIVATGNWSEAEAVFTAFRDDMARRLKMEEEVIFSTLTSVSGSPGPLQVMLMDHSQIKGLLEQMAVAVTQKNAQTYSSLLETLLIVIQRHNFKEEQTLYPIVDRILATRRESLFPYRPEMPWPKAPRENCIFYHAMSFPNGTAVEGPWDIQDSFRDYIGNYSLRGKTVLDVGTASGYLAFAAEQQGAVVTAIDALSAVEIERLPFEDTLYHQNRTAWVQRSEPWLITLKNGFWYAWHEYQSKVEVVYAPLDRLPYWNRRFDVVIAGAILEHLANPIAVIENIAGLANEAVIIAFTPVGDTGDQVMQTANDWSSNADSHSFTFWTISRGLYRRVFNNLGFDVEFVTAKAKANGAMIERPTVIARRRKIPGLT